MNDYIIQLDIKDNNEIKMKAKNFEEAWNKSQELIKNEYPMMYVWGIRRLYKNENI